MTSLVSLDPLEGGQNKPIFTSSGAIAAGKPVVLNTNGTVAQITGSTASIDASYGDVDVIQEATGGSKYSISTDPFNTGKFIVGFEDKRSGQSEKPMVVVGTTSGSTVTFGTPVAIHSGSAGGNGTVVQFDPTYENRVIVSYYAPSTGSTIGSLTLNGTAVTINSGAAQFYSSNGGKMDPGMIAFDTTQVGFFIIGYCDSGQDGYYRGGSVAANGTVTLGSQTSIANTQFRIHGFSVRCNKSGKFLISGSDANGDPYCCAAVATLSNSRAVTLGSFFTWNSLATDKILRADWDPNDDTKFIVGGDHSGSPYPSKVYVATVDGTTITYGSPTTFFDEDIPQKSLIRFNPNPTSTGEFAIIYHKTGVSPNQQLRVARCTYSGTAITVQGTYSLHTEYGYYEVTAEFDISSGVLYIVARYDNAASVSNPNWGRLWKMQFENKPSNLTTTNLIGVADEAIADGATGRVNTWGSVNSTQSGMTIGSDYYAQHDGNITISNAANSGQQLLGKAISATKLNIKDYTG